MGTNTRKGTPTPHRQRQPTTPVNPNPRGCELCGDWPVTLSGRCNPSAPLRAEMTDPSTLILSCYVPECGREVARFKLDTTPDEGEG